MRAALAASQLCQRLSAAPELRPDFHELVELSEHYEDLATQTLGAIRESAVAYALLSVIPWELSTHRESGAKRIVLMYDSSVLEEVRRPSIALIVYCSHVPLACLMLAACVVAGCCS